MCINSKLKLHLNLGNRHRQDAYLFSNCCLIAWKHNGHLSHYYAIVCIEQNKAVGKIVPLWPDCQWRSRYEAHRHFYYCAGYGDRRHISVGMMVMTSGISRQICEARLVLARRTLGDIYSAVISH